MNEAAENPSEKREVDGSAPEPVSAPDCGASTAEDLRSSVIETLRTVYDPEIPVDIYELGLIYDIQISDNGDTLIEMTLTSPNCPAAESLPGEVKQKTGDVSGIGEVEVKIVWDPTWTPERMTEAAKLELGMW